MKKSFRILSAGCFLFLGAQSAAASDDSQLLEAVKQLEEKVQTMQGRIDELEGKNDVRDERLTEVEEQSVLATKFAEGLGTFTKAGDDKAVVWFGDLRFRYEYENQSAERGSFVATSRYRDRYRVRARLGAKANITENWFGEVRLATGGGTSLGSPHEDLGLLDQNLNNGAIKVDRVNIGYNFVDYNTKLRIGKFGLNTTSYTDLIMDGDISPEGFDVTYEHNGLKLNATGIIVSEVSWQGAGGTASTDQKMFILDGAYSFDLGVKTTVSLGYAAIDDGTNSRLYEGENTFFGTLMLKSGDWKVAGEYFNSNGRVADTAWTIQGQYKLSREFGLSAYYCYVEAFSLPADGIFTQDNFPGPVTNWKGYRFQADYAFNQHVALDVRYYWLTYITDSSAAGAFGGLVGSANLQPTRDIGRSQINLNLMF